MGNVNEQNSAPSSLIIPKNYPNTPQIGKISLLFNANDFYHKYNPKDYDYSGGFGASQPYVYKYPTTRTSGQFGFPMGQGVDDLKRVTNYIASGRGILFLTKQFLLQGFNTFDETNLLNPTWVVLSAASNLTGNLVDRPIRFINKSGGLLGGLAQFIGISVSRGNAPPSTVAGSKGSGISNFLIGSSSNREAEVLPTSNLGQATGLLRGKTANKGKSILMAKWGVGNNQKEGIWGFIKNIAKSVFPQVFGSERQTAKYRGDEDAYNYMLSYYNAYTSKNISKGTSQGINVNLFGINLFNKKNNVEKTWKSSTKSFEQKYYKISDTNKKIYKNDLLPSNPEDDSYEEVSNIKDINQELIDNNPPVRNNVINDDTTKKINNNLQQVINNINSNTLYSFNITNKDSRIYSSGQTTKQGYDRLYSDNKDIQSKKINNNGAEAIYKQNDVATLDYKINPNKNYGFAGFGKPDKINTLTILNKDKKTGIFNDGGNFVEWKPYDDDLIAFFFYDVVNDKYIPFRATVKGISEANSANWEELRFIGRADSLYNYSGFTRTLSFNFTVVVNSIIELLPVWKRLNYLCSSVKPSGYTKRKQGDKLVNRFLIPPMFMLTIGDLYKYQPIVINNITMNVPDNAIWETVPEIYEDSWSYLAGLIKADVAINRTAQLPREIEVSVACNVLEKERAILGGSHFGHAPELDDESGYLVDDKKSYLPPVKPFSVQAFARTNEGEVESAQTTESPSGFQRSGWD